MARKKVCVNLNKKTGKFQKTKTKNTKRVCYTRKGSAAKKASGRRAASSGRRATTKASCRGTWVKGSYKGGKRVRKGYCRKK